MSKRFLLFLVIILMISLVSAVPPVTQVPTGADINIAYPKYSYISTNTNFSLHIHAFNSSDFILPKSPNNCYFHFYRQDGKHGVEQIMTADSNGFDFKYDIEKGNFTETGVHAYIIFCNTTSQTGFASGTVVVTHNGVMPETPTITLYGIGLFIILLTIFFLIFVMMTVEHPVVKAGTYLFAHLFMVLLTFCLWTLCDGFLIAFTGLTTIFKVMFYVSITSLFPAIMFAFVWILYVYLVNDEISAMMEKGLEPEDAYKRARGKWKIF